MNSITKVALLFGLPQLLCLTIGCSEKPEPIAGNQSQTEATLEERGPGIWQETLRGNGADEADTRFTVFVPKAYQSGTNSPLIFTLHFGGRVTPHYGRQILEALTLPALQELDAIIVAPDSTGGGWLSEENEKSVKAIFEAVNKAYSIDANKTLVTGFSLGGHGSFHFGFNHPEMFKAAVPIAGSPGAQYNDAELVTAFYVIHSKIDEVVPIGPTREFVEAQKARDANVTFIELENLSHYQTPAYVPSLKAAVPWITKTWNNE